ncbi:MAG: SIMPL domain-containing protein [Rikenellaceae bacterium]|nr:SIMPL domain-containing protein [Rikenellaceae bacterium]
MKKIFLMLCLACVALGASAQDVAVQCGTVSVMGEAKVSVDPDEFVVELTLMEGDGKNDRLTIVEKHKKLVTALKKAGIDPSLLKTDDISNSRYKRKDTRTSIRYELELSGFDKVLAAFDAFAEAGVRQARLASSKYSREKQVREELMAEAVRDAKQKATILVEAADMSLGVPQSIEMPSVNVYMGTLRTMNYKSAAVEAEESLADLNLQQQQIEMSARVNVTYKIMQKVE